MDNIAIIIRANLCADVVNVPGAKIYDVIWQGHEYVEPNEGMCPHSTIVVLMEFGLIYLDVKAL